MRAPSAAPACHSDCWSLWENRLLGKVACFAMYCALVVGVISVPTLARIASWPEAKSVCRLGSCGCNANVRAVPLGTVPAGHGWEVFGTIGKTPPMAAGDPPGAVVSGAVPGAIRAIGDAPWLRAAW